MQHHEYTVACSCLITSLPPTGLNSAEDRSTLPSLYDGSWLPLEPTTTNWMSAWGAGNGGGGAA